MKHAATLNSHTLGLKTRQADPSAAVAHARLNRRYDEGLVVAFLASGGKFQVSGVGESSLAPRPDRPAAACPHDFSEIPRNRITSRPVSRVLSGGFPPRRPFVWGACCRAPRATNPGGSLDETCLPTVSRRQPRRPYLVLLPVGFALPAPLPELRCALTAPFHPCLSRAGYPAGPVGGLFSVARSLRSPSAAVSRHRSSMEPGLSSTRILSPKRSQTDSDRPAGWWRE